MKRISKLLSIAMMLIPTIIMAQSIVDYQFATGVDGSKWRTLSSSATTASSLTGNDARMSATGCFIGGSPFKFGGRTYYHFSMSTNGRLRFGSTSVSTDAHLPFTSAATADFPMVCAMGGDFWVSTTNNEYVKYEVQGTAPNRVLVVEYCGGHRTTSSSEHMVYQIQVEEATSIIRFVYGASSITSSSPYQVGLASSKYDVLTVNTTDNTLSYGMTSATNEYVPQTYRYYEFTPTTTECPRHLLEYTEAGSGAGYHKLKWTPSLATQTPSYELTVKDITAYLPNPGTWHHSTTDTFITMRYIEPRHKYMAEMKVKCGDNVSVTDTLYFYGAASNMQFTSHFSHTYDGDNHDNNTYQRQGPLNEYYRYNVTATIYTPEEVGGSGVMYWMTYFHNKDSYTSKTGNWCVYMAPTSLNELPNNYSVNLSQMTKVYTSTTKRWSNYMKDMDIDGFYYAGTSNLLVVVVDSSDDYDTELAFAMHEQADGAPTRFLYANTDNVDQFSNIFTNMNGNGYIPIAAFYFLKYQCEAPTASVSDITTTSANISWQQAAACPLGSSWEIEYGEVGFTHGDGTFEITSTPSINLTGLTPGTAYQAYIRAHSSTADGSAYSEWSAPINFSTNGCGMVQNFTQTRNGNYVTVAWNAGINNNGTYEVEYGPLGFARGSGTTTTIGTPSINIAVNEGENYDVYVRSACAGGTMSEWARTQTTPVNINTVDMARTAMTIYPNPATETTTISINGIDGQVTIEIVDLNGRTMRSHELTCNGDCSVSVNVSDMPKGVYFVRLSGNGVKEVSRLVIR